MPKNLFEIISEVMNIPISQINDDSGAGTIEEWDSFNMYVLLNAVSYTHLTLPTNREV